MLEKYRLNDGNIYWHKLYFALMPEWTKNYAPPFGDYNYASYFYRPHKYIGAIYDKVKWFIQRGSRGYADCDLWSLDSYLAGWLPDAILYLEKYKHGTPVGMTPKGWGTRLRIIREGFEAVKEMDGIPALARYKKLKRKMDKGLKLFARYYLNLWD